MASGTIVNVWQDAQFAYAAVSVQETDGPVEYIGKVARAQFDGMTGPQKKAALVQAVKQVRDAQQGGTSPIAGLTGSVTL